MQNMCLCVCVLAKECLNVSIRIKATLAKDNRGQLNKVLDVRSEHMH